MLSHYHIMNSLNGSNTACTAVSMSLLNAQWNMEYLTHFRLCLVSTKILYDAFQSTENLGDTVTLEDFKKGVQGFHYNEQVNTTILKDQGRPTPIQVAIHFYSIPASFLVHFNQEMTGLPGQLEKYQAQQKKCYQEFYALGQMELDIFYHKFEKNVSNYLYYLLVKNVPDSIRIITSATISREDLIELHGRINSPSTICENKTTICQVIKQRIADMPEVMNDNKVEEVIVITRKRVVK